MTYDEHDYQAIEARLRAAAPAIRPGVRERILDECAQRQRGARQARTIRTLALRAAVAWVVAMQCLTVLWLDNQSASLLTSNGAAATPATLLAASPPVTVEFERRSLQVRFRTLAVLLSNDDINSDRPSKEASDGSTSNTRPTPSADYSG